MLVAQPLCDKTAKNKQGKTPYEVICTRSAVDSAARKPLVSLFENTCYLPLYRDDEGAAPPRLGKPEQTPSPKNLAACVGPVSPTVAASLFDSIKSPRARLHNQAILRTDDYKGMERLMRKACDELNVASPQYVEYWDILDRYCNLRSAEPAWHSARVVLEAKVAAATSRSFRSSQCKAS